MVDSSSAKPEFNKFQAIFWPIHRFELKKFLPMSFLMFFMLLVYRMVNDFKNVFLQTKAHVWLNATNESSTNLISATKFWFVFPSTFLAVMIFTVLISKFGERKTFYILITSFMLFYAVFGFVIFPNMDVFLMSSEGITDFQSRVPSIFYTVVACLGNWPYTLFYVVSEIWGIMVVASLFWQFANKTTKKSEIKRFFALFSVIGDIGVLISGTTLKAMSTVKGSNFDKNVVFVMGGVVICCAIIMSLYYSINKYVLTDPRFYEPSMQEETPKKEKVKFTEGLSVFIRSKYLLLLFVMLVGVGLTLNLTEISWESQLKMLYPDPNKYSDMKANLSIIISLGTIAMVFLSANLLMRSKWKTCALVAPFIYLVFGTPFFALVLSGRTEIMGFPALNVSIWLGLMTMGLAKSVKYSLVDTNRNMAYIPLDEVERTKGQAAVEVIGGRTGKAGGSALQQFLVTVVNTGSNISAHFPVIASVFVVSLIGWIVAVFRVGPKYEKAVAMRENESGQDNA